MQIDPGNLTIPLQPGDALDADYGVVDIESFGPRADGIDALFFRAVAFVRNGDRLMTDVQVPPGKYVTHIRQPRGDRMTKLIDIAAHAQGGIATVELSTQAYMPETGADALLPHAMYSPAVAPVLHQRGFFVDGTALAAPRTGSSPGVSLRGLLLGDAAQLSTKGLVSAFAAGGHPYQKVRFPGAVTTADGEVAVNNVLALAGGRRAGAAPSLRTLVPAGGTLEWDGLRAWLGLETAASDFKLGLPLPGVLSARIEDELTSGQQPSVRYVLAHMAVAPADGQSPFMETDILARLPGPGSYLSTDAPGAVHLDASVMHGAGSLHVRLADARLQAILDFMQQADLHAALSLFGSALEPVLREQANPYAAAAAAYLVLAVPPQCGPQSHLPPDWYTWIASLGRRYPDLPDGCIQHAALLLQSPVQADNGAPASIDFPSEPDARVVLATRLVLESMYRGLPLYRRGFQLLVSNLRILLNEDLPVQSRQQLEAALSLVNQLRMRLNVNEPFTVVDLTGMMHAASERHAIEMDGAGQSNVGTPHFGDNGPEVEILQQALFDRRFYSGVINGAFDTATLRALLAFQESAGLKQDGIAGQESLRALGLLDDDTVTDPVTGLSVLCVRAMCKQAPLANIRKHLPNINRALLAHGMQAPHMVLMAIATIHVESPLFEPIVEGISALNTVPGGPPFGKYESRADLGNLGPGDGQMFRGRGFVQLTGRANYAKYGRSLRPPAKLEATPECALDSAIAADVLCVHFKMNQHRIAAILSSETASVSEKLAGLRRIVSGGGQGLDEFIASWSAGAAAMGLPLSHSLRIAAFREA